MLDIAANIAEIVAGLALLGAAFKAWPVFDRIEASSRKRSKTDLREDASVLAKAMQENFQLDVPDLTPVALLRQLLLELPDCNAYDLHFEYFPEQKRPGRLSYSTSDSTGHTRPELVTLTPDGYAEFFDALRQISKVDSDGDDRLAYLEVGPHRYVLNIATSISGPVASVLLAPSKVLTVEQLQLNEERWWPRIEALLSGARRCLILVAGAVGSGKQTTAASLVEYASRNKTWKVVTAEHPVDFVKNGVAQFTCEDPSNFKKAYSDALGQVPDIFFLSAPEPGEFLWNAYGRRITTLGNVTAADAPSALEVINRQGRTAIKTIDIPFIILGQHLVRLLCESCKVQVTLSQEDQVKIRRIREENADNETAIGSYFEPVGCEHCQHGYTGRTALQEVLDVSAEMLMPEIQDAYQIRRLAITTGMRTIQYQALLKANDGEIAFSALKSISSELRYATSW